MALVAAQPLTPRHQQGHSCDPNPGLSMTFGGNIDLELFNTDSGCGKTTDPDMILSSSRVWMSPLPQVAVQASQISTATVVVVVQLSDTNMVPGHVIKVA